jgi:Zn-dependent M28 family amino/carboxypeptidase
VPLYRTVANINIDGIASFDEFNSIIPIGAGYSTLSTFIEDAAARNQLSITGLQTAFVQTGAFDRSDQIAFAQAGIPSVLISEGIDFKHLTYREGLGKLIHYSENVYHTPFDDLSIPINYKAVRQHLKLLYDAAELLASSEETPEWNPGVPHKRERLRSIAEKR